MGAATQLVIGGAVSSGFESVRGAFVENFTRRGELGAACCVYQDGEKVVDLWGGVRDRASGEPWRADTMVLVHSATKGFAAMVLADRGMPSPWLVLTARQAWRLMLFDTQVTWPSQ